MLRIGIVGFGSRIGYVVNNVIKASKGEVALVAYYDPSPKAVARVAEKHPDIRQCASVEELVTAEDIDWVFIGSFNALHGGHAVAALDAGKHVFCEKPLATTRQQCMDIVAARKRNPSKQFIVGFVLRYSAFYRKLKQWIEEDRLGQLISMEINETLSPYHGASMHGNWRRKTQWGGPMILEKCCHDIDLMLWITGSQPSRVASFGGLTFFKPENAHYNDLYPVGKEGYKYYDRGLATGYAVGSEENVPPFSDDKDTVDNQVAIMELENGARVSFHFCMHSTLRERRFYMSGTKGTIRANVLSGTLEYAPVGWDAETESVRPIEGDGHGGADEPMAQDVLHCMLHGTPPPTTLRDGLRASFTCFGMEEARETGTVVQMDGYWNDLSNAIP